MSSITGLGLVTPLGDTVDQTWSALLAGRFITNHAKLSDRSDRLAVSAATSAAEAIAQAGWSRSILSSDSTALIVGTSKGPIVDWIDSMTAPPGLGNSTSDNPTAGRASAACGLARLSTDLAAHLCLRSGPQLVLSAACASGLHAVIRGAMMIRSGEVRRAIVVAAEASVHPLFLGSFSRLGVFPPAEIGCRPFDRNRAGFLMSEAAAAVCLEASEVADSSRTIARIDRFAMGADAMHLTAGDPTGRTLRYLMQHVLGGRAVDLIHAHGTGTEMNDQIELDVIESVLKDMPAHGMPNLYSHKGSLGHSLGAAGLVALALSAQTHRTQSIPPNVRTTEPIPMNHVRLSRAEEHRGIESSLTMAAGFGGPMGVVRLTSP